MQVSENFGKISAIGTTFHLRQSELTIKAVHKLSLLSTLYASPIAAGGHIYITGRSGTTIVIEDSAEFRVVSQNSVGEGVDATPAPVDDELFIRGEKHLFCIGE